MIDIAKQIAALEQALGELPSASLARAGLETMLQQLRAATPSPPPPRQIGGVRLDSTHIDQMGDAVGGNQIHGNQYIYNGLPGDDPAYLVRRYCAHVIRETQRLTFVDTDSVDAEQNALLLYQVYIRLEVATQVNNDSKPLNLMRRRKQLPFKPDRQMTALEALQQHGRLVLLGAPGSGKSTFARHLAGCLARASCGEAGLEYLQPEWRHAALTPIWIELSPLAEWLKQHDKGQSSGELLWNYLADQHTLALAAELRRCLESDSAVLLLDGLDEVADGQPLRRVRAMIEALTVTRAPSMVLLTCRVLDYAEKRRQLNGWSSETLLPFSDALQQTFIATWFHSLEREGRLLQRSADELITLLGRAVRAKPDLKGLAGNPLLLTMMATLQGAKGALPDKRVELYGECLELLLRRWHRRKGQPDLESFLGIADWRRNDTDRLLDHLGYTAESHGLDNNDDDTSQTGSAHLTRRELIDAAANVFANHVPNPLTYAERLCEYIDCYGSNGIVQKHGPDNYRFPHRTFREFLAARRLISNSDWPEDERVLTVRLQRRATSVQWHEALVLAASLLVAQNRPESVADLAWVLLNEHKVGSQTWAECVIVAGEVLAQTDRRQLARCSKTEVWDNTIAALCRIVAPPSRLRAKPPHEAASRVRAGTVLGKLGDSRPGVTALKPQWCDVLAGPFQLGSNDTSDEAKFDGRPQRTVDLPGFRIARYPITNAQWRMFLEADGYRERCWWSDAGWLAKESAGWNQPDKWDNPRFNTPNQPIVGISWYEATAFCRWLSTELDYVVRLPSEAEWEKAARGTDGRIYPWGDKGNADYANMGEIRLNQTAPVGCYPRDCSPYNVMDMSSNVWEWTATLWTDNYQQSDGTTRETEDGAQFVWRGGAWSRIRRTTRCAYRYYTSPATRDHCLGMRIVAALTPTK